MQNIVDFFIVGAQKGGTSWMYACMYEHPDICIPNKEPHFFSREKNLKKGIGWYESTYNRCAADALKGECSTSYLSAEDVPAKLYAHNLDAKIIISLRNPVDRAFSQYRNSIKAGEISANVSFADACVRDESIVSQGLYHDQVKRYQDAFGAGNVLVLVYEDIAKDSAVFIKKIFTFLGVDSGFVPSLLHRKVNTARTPRFVAVDRAMIHIAECMRKIGLEKIVWAVKKGGVPALLRRVNTTNTATQLADSEKNALQEVFKEDVRKLSVLLGRDMDNEWL